jgi:hypothetical protein
MGKHVHIEAEPIHLNITPLGFIIHAKDYYKAGKSFQNSPPRASTPRFLFCLSLELALKGFLLANGIPKKELATKRYGHDLEKLLTKAQELGLNKLITITPEQEEEIKKANIIYSNKKEGGGFVYFNVFYAGGGGPPLPDLSILEKITNSLISSLEPFCRQAV